MAALHRPALPAPRIFGKARSPRLLLYIAGALVVVIAMAQVNEFSRLTSTGYEVESLRRTRDLELARNHRLEAEVASLSSLARVDWVARTQLGMEPAARRLHIEVNQPVPAARTLPTRFLPLEEQRPVEAPDSEPAWWRSAANWLNPF